MIDGLSTLRADRFAALLEAAAGALERGSDPAEVAGALRGAAGHYRQACRPPLTTRDVEHAAARLRADDPRTVFPDLGRALADAEARR